jgi:hypothetical protein
MRPEMKALRIINHITISPSTLHDPLIEKLLTLGCQLNRSDVFQPLRDKDAEAPVPLRERPTTHLIRTEVEQVEHHEADIVAPLRLRGG